MEITAEKVYQTINNRRSATGLSVRCERCHKLLGVFDKAKGEVKCPRCKHIQRIDLKDE